MMVETLLSQQKALIDYFYQRFNQSEFDKLLLSVKDAEAFYFSGVGKSGIIAEKGAKTLLSFGVMAHHLNPLDALHGDLGMVDRGVALLFSKSGETKEILLLNALLQKRSICTVGVHSDRQSTLAQQATLAIELPFLQELSPYEHLPTVSTALQLLFSDLFAIALLQARKIRLERFAENHPGGWIGKKLLLTAEDLMLKGEALPISSAKARLIDVLFEISSKRSGVLLIVEKGELLGLFTDGDLRRALLEKGTLALEEELESLMNRHFRVARKESKCSLLIQEMQEARISVLPVVEEGKLLGLLRLHDLLQAGY